MIINAPKLSMKMGKSIISSVIEYSSRKEILWYSVDTKYSDFLTSDKLDGFVVAVLPLAMKYGEDIKIEGAISEKLFYNLTNYFIVILKAVIPSLHEVRLLPKYLVDKELLPNSGGVVTGFSGGIDSFSVIADHLFGDVPPNFRITHFIYNNVGGHGNNKLFENRYSKLRGFTEEVNLDFVKIDSNLRDFMGKEPFVKDFMLTSLPRNVSAVLMLQNLFSKYLYASSYAYKDCFVGECSSIAHAEPSVVHLLSTEILECISTGCQYSRVQKTDRITEIEESTRYLDVCMRNEESAGNCSTCEKCARTLLTLEALGKEHLYAKVFDLPAYRRIRDHYIKTILLSRNEFHNEIVDLLIERQYPFTLTQKLLLSPPAKTFRNVLPKAIRNTIHRLVGIRH